MFTFSANVINKAAYLVEFSSSPVNFTRQVTDFGLCVIYNSEDLIPGNLMVSGAGTI